MQEYSKQPWICEDCGYHNCFYHGVCHAPTCTSISPELKQTKKRQLLKLQEPQPKPSTSTSVQQRPENAEFSTQPWTCPTCSHHNNFYHTMCQAPGCTTHSPDITANRLKQQKQALLNAHSPTLPS
jgi:hypothetical protein